MEEETSFENYTISTNEENLESADESLSLTDSVVLSVFALFVMLLSLLGNSFTCLIVYKKKPMRSAINLLLTSIAMSDVILITSLTPVVLYNLLKSDISIFEACVALSFLKDTCVSVASYTLLVISVDKYLIIVHRRDRLCSKFARTVIIIIWFGSICINIPQFLSFIGDDYEAFDSLFCNTNRSLKVSDYRIFYTNILLLTIFYIPVVVMFYLYASILRTVQMTSKRIHNHSGSSVSVSVTQYSSKLGLPTIAVPYRFTGDFNAKRKAFGTILLLFVTLFCCWLPYTTSRTISSVNRHGLTDIVLLLLGFLKSALYPVIFGARNKKFRVACRRYLPTQFRMPKSCLERKQRRVNPKILYKCPEFETRF